MDQKLKKLTDDTLKSQALSAENGDVFEIEGHQALMFYQTCYNIGRAAKKRQTITKGVYHVQVLDGDVSE
jgi:hypothetical protein